MPMSINVLVVEDDPLDVKLLETQLGMQKIYLRTFSVRDGQEALDYLARRGRWVGWPKTDMVLLDWNLPPPIHSFDVLRAIRESTEYQKVAVVILTASPVDGIKAAAKEAGAQCVLRKPLTLECIASIVQAVPNFWHSIVWMPD